MTTNTITSKLIVQSVFIISKFSHFLYDTIAICICEMTLYIMSNRNKSQS